MASGKEIVDRENFDQSGPSHLTEVDWTNPNHRRSIAACLVKSVYILERDREEKREGTKALAPRWYEFFHFQLYRLLVDDADSCIFGAIFQLTSSKSTQESPHHVIAFRGTITKGRAFTRDFIHNVRLIKNGLHRTSRFEIALQEVCHVIATFGSSNIWLAGHSLGAAIAMLAGKNMAKNNVLLNTFLFNPPFLKHGICIAGRVITAGLAFAMKNNQQENRSGDSFTILSSWFPDLYVNPSDHICSGYVGYFELRKRMDEIGVGGIEMCASQHSIMGLLLNVMGKQPDEPMHLIPSANLTVNRTPARDFKDVARGIHRRWKVFKDAHDIHQWWRPDLVLECKSYNFS